MLRLTYNVLCSVHSWRAPHHANRNAAAEPDPGAVLLGDGGHRLSLVPRLHRAPGGLPLHYQTCVQVRPSAHVTLWAQAFGICAAGNLWLFRASRDSDSDDFIDPTESNSFAASPRPAASIQTTLSVLCGVQVSKTTKQREVREGHQSAK